MKHLVIALTLFVGGCATVPEVTTTDKAAQCAAWQAITYSARHDTKITVDQIRVHNEVGRTLGCW